MKTKQFEKGDLVYNKRHDKLMIIDEVFSSGSWVTLYYAISYFTLLNPSSELTIIEKGAFK